MDFIFPKWFLIAEADDVHAQLLRSGLEAGGHRVRVENNGVAALRAYREEPPDLIIVDHDLPVKNGEQVLAEVRRNDPHLPVLILSQRKDVESRVRCLDAGADDVILRPFSLSELFARCRAHLRRNREPRLLLRAGPLELDRLEHNVSCNGESVDLTKKEFAILEHLLLNRGRCVSRTELLEYAWKMEPAQSTNIVDVYVNYLRRKLKDPPPGRVILTIRGQGYVIPHEEVNTQPMAAASR